MLVQSLVIILAPHVRPSISLPLKVIFSNDPHDLSPILFSSWLIHSVPCDHDHSSCSKVSLLFITVSLLFPLHSALSSPKFRFEIPFWFQYINPSLIPVNLGIKILACVLISTSATGLEPHALSSKNSLSSYTCCLGQLVICDESSIKLNMYPVVKDNRQSQVVLCDEHMRALSL